LRHPPVFLSKTSVPKHKGQESTLVYITRHLSNFYCIQYFKDRSFVEPERLEPHSLSRFADAKVGTFSHPPNFFRSFFEKILRRLIFNKIAPLFCEELHFAIRISIFAPSLSRGECKDTASF
ncbi:MAG: hypothetical protein IJP79_07920, partial [Paludibacteraceae bacterium]|nr:hypothetical protein [Paludibacteraceae bacterium]